MTKRRLYRVRWICRCCEGMWYALATELFHAATSWCARCNSSLCSRPNDDPLGKCNEGRVNKRPNPV